MLSDFCIKHIRFLPVFTTFLPTKKSETYYKFAPFTFVHFLSTFKVKFIINKRELPPVTMNYYTFQSLSEADFQ